MYLLHIDIIYYNGSFKGVMPKKNKTDSYKSLNMQCIGTDFCRNLFFDEKYE